jgi:hypothetical protein
VQFFDAADTLGACVADFVQEALSARADALIVAKPSSIQAAGRALSERGLVLSSLLGAGRLTVVDAWATLQSFMSGLDPDPERFAAVVGSILRQRRDASKGPLHVYGEMVDILASEGNFTGAARLERLWSALLSAQPARLMCGYLAPHFATPYGAGALREICECHDHVRHDPGDPLADWLLARAMA